MGTHIHTVILKFLEKQVSGVEWWVPLTPSPSLLLSQERNAGPKLSCNAAQGLSTDRQQLHQLGENSGAPCPGPTELESLGWGPECCVLADSPLDSFTQKLEKH